MRETIISIELEKEELQQDLNRAIYMLHFLEDGFSQAEVRDVCFTLKYIVDHLSNPS